MTGLVGHGVGSREDSLHTRAEGAEAERSPGEKQSTHLPGPLWPPGSLFSATFQWAK